MPSPRPPPRSPTDPTPARSSSSTTATATSRAPSPRAAERPVAVVSPLKVCRQLIIGRALFPLHAPEGAPGGDPVALARSEGVAPEGRPVVLLDAEGRLSTVA